jgi:hypothetical protein
METVTENKFLTEEELQTLKTIQTETQALIAELGEISLIRLQIDERYNQAKAFLDGLVKREQEFNQSIIDTHGRSNINPETGEITPLT